MATYRGWIPTISGKLSFSVFGQTEHPTRSDSANVADEKIRYMTAFQFRNASDVLIPFSNITAPFLLGIDGRIWFAFIAKTERGDHPDQFYLKGRAFMFTDQRDWRKHVLPAIQFYQAKLRGFILAAQEDLSSAAESEQTNLIDLCNRHCSFYADVAIRRTGTTQLSIPDTISLPAGAPALPADPIKLKRICWVLSSQLFYFVKDLGHRHQHHDMATDQIIPLYEIKGDDDISWRHHTLFSLYREVIRIKRQPNMATLSNSLGLIAYADSFIKISGEEKIKQENLPAYNSPETIASIKAIQARVERQHAIKQRRLDMLRTTVLSVAGVIFSFFGLLKLSNYPSTISPSPIITRPVEWVLTSPLQSIAVLIVGVGGFIYAWPHTGATLPSWYIKFVRLFQFLRWQANAAVAFGIAIVAALLFLRLLVPGLFS